MKPGSGDLNVYDWKVVWWDVVAPPGVRRIVVWLGVHYPGKVDFDIVLVVKLNGRAPGCASIHASGHGWLEESLVGVTRS